jgi:hypothetical protein
LFTSGAVDVCEKATVSLDTSICAPTVDLKKPLEQTIAGSKLQTKKKVTFAPTSPVSVPDTRPEITESVKDQIWYNRADLQVIRGKARSLALRIHSNRQKNDFEYSYAQTMEATFKQARNLSEEEELKLWAWFSQAHARRGLERLSANQVGRNRQAKAAIRKVLKAQKDLASVKKDKNTKAAMLALVSEGETDQARALAAVFGKADMVAANLA